MTQLRIPAVYMRGGTSKGVFFLGDDLPADRAERDRVLLRVIGSPDPYGKQIDGMGAATSSTSKIVIVSKSSRADCDVDYLFGQVAIDRPLIDWSGNCGNLTSAVGPFAIAAGLVAAPNDGIAADIGAFESDAGLRNELRRSLQVMLGFYGLRLVDAPGAPRIERSGDYDSRSAQWLARSHNFLRISRILRSLTLLGCAPEARAFLQCLEEIRRENAPDIGPDTLRYWRRAIEPR